LPALGHGAKYRLTWISHAGSLLATYADIEGRTYTTVCVENQNSISNKNKFPSLKPVQFAYQIKNAQSGT